LIIFNKDSYERDSAVLAYQVLLILISPPKSLSAKQEPIGELYEAPFDAVYDETSIAGIF
jgi:hypothetical protein